MPLHSQQDLHTKTKNFENESETNIQEGKGSNDVNDDTEAIEKETSPVENINMLLSQTKSIKDNVNPLEFNERKRKLLGPEIHNSFMNPSFVKTSKLVLIKDKKKTNSELPNISEAKKPNKKDIKHNFKFT